MSGSVSCGVTAPFPWVLVDTWFGCALQESSLCFPSLIDVLQQNPTGIQVQNPWEFLISLLNPQVGNPDMGIRTLQQWETFFGIIVLQCVGCPLNEYGVGFHCDCGPPTTSLSFLHCLWMWVAFLVGSNILLLIVI